MGLRPPAHAQASASGGLGRLRHPRACANPRRVEVSANLAGEMRRGIQSVYNESRQLIAQYEKTGTGPLTWKKDIVYVGTKEIAEVDATGTMITFVDHLGSPRFSWKGGTTPIMKQKFLPFGETLDTTNSGKFAKGWTNHEATDASGLIYAQARFYLPWMGRFASPDPARDQHFEETQSWNIYSYCQNNPIMSTDPTGMYDFGILGGIAKGLYKEAKGMVSGAAHFVKETVMGRHPVARAAVAGGNALVNASNDPKGTAMAAGKVVVDTVKAADTPEKQAELATRVAVNAVMLLGTGGLGEGASAARVGELAGVAGEAGKASSAMDGLNLSKQLASEAQMGEVGTSMAGAGGRATFRDAGRVAAEYGGDAADWSKKSSSTFTAKDGTKFETHWVENSKTGQRYEYKTKFPDKEK